MWQCSNNAWKTGASESGFLCPAAATMRTTSRTSSASPASHWPTPAITSAWSSTNGRAGLLSQVDVAHVHQPFISGSFGLYAANRYNTPLVFTNHTRVDLYVKQYLKLLPAVVSETALQTYFQTFSQGCSALVAPSESIAAMMREWGVQGRIVVIPNGIEVERFRQPDTSISKAELGLPEDAIVAMYVGRMSSEKSIDRLLYLFRYVASEHPSVYLLLVGEGPELVDLRAIARQPGADEARSLCRRRHLRPSPRLSPCRRLLRLRQPQRSPSAHLHRSRRRRTARTRLLLHRHQRHYPRRGNRPHCRKQRPQLRTALSASGPRPRPAPEAWLSGRRICAQTLRRIQRAPTAGTLPRTPRPLNQPSYTDNTGGRAVRGLPSAGFRV